MAVTARSEGLTPFDTMMPKLYTCLVLAFRSTHSPDAIRAGLQEALHATAKHISWISGTVKPADESAGAGSSISWAPNSSLPELGDAGTVCVGFDAWMAAGMPPSDIPTNKWSLTGGIDDREDGMYPNGAPVFGWSLFRFEDAQGVGLCISIHHHVADAYGTGEIIRILAQSAAGAHRDIKVADRKSHLHSALSPDFEIAAEQPVEQLLAAHPEYTIAPMVFPAEFPVCTSKVLAFSVAKLRALKDRLQLEPTTSTNTVLSAVLWSEITRARLRRDDKLLERKTTRLCMAVNGRKRIGESFSTVDHPYFGNLIFYSWAEMQLTELKEENTYEDHLANICNLVAGSVSKDKINRAHIAEVHALRQKLEPDQNLLMGTDMFGSRDLTITSWADLDIYEMDFGRSLGKPVAVRLPHFAGPADGVCVVLPRRRAALEKAADEVLEVVVMLRTDDLEAIEPQLASLIMYAI